MRSGRKAFTAHSRATVNALRPERIYLYGLFCHYDLSDDVIESLGVSNELPYWEAVHDEGCFAGDGHVGASHTLAEGAGHEFNRFIVLPFCPGDAKSGMLIVYARNDRVNPRFLEFVLLRLELGL